MPDPHKEPVEEYIVKIQACLDQYAIKINTTEEFQEIRKSKDHFTVVTRGGSYHARRVVLAFGSNIPVELGVYGEAKTIARKLENPEDHLGAPTLVLGGGNAAADVVSTLSKAKRAADDPTPVYWGNRLEHFTINKDVARDLGEEILLGGHIKILQGVIPKIGEVDEDGVDRLLVQSQGVDLGQGAKLEQWMSFPMKHVIACIGTQGPSPVFDRLGLQQITCTEGVCKLGQNRRPPDHVDARLPDQPAGDLRHRRRRESGIYRNSGRGTFRERKHSNLIYTAVRDAELAMNHIAVSLDKG